MKVFENGDMVFSRGKQIRTKASIKILLLFVSASFLIAPEVSYSEVAPGLSPRIRGTVLRVDADSRMLFGEHRRSTTYPATLGSAVKVWALDIKPESLNLIVSEREVECQLVDYEEDRALGKCVVFLPEWRGPEDAYLYRFPIDVRALAIAERLGVDTCSSQFHRSGDIEQQSAQSIAHCEK